MGADMSVLAKRWSRKAHVLILMRHAKAESGVDLPDIDRPLTDKGLKQAKRMAKGLVAADLVPDRIACSGAARARQTLDRMLAVLGDHPKVDYRKSLYDGGVQAVFEELRQTSDDTHVLLVLTHEPTVSVAAQWLSSSDSDAGALSLVGLGMPVGSAAILTADEPYSRWQVRSARLEGVVRPKDLR
ncbi:histidine phosphatase family protein [uncultured Bifidobacterium sp.]|uniref:SixA phosphatase family protein n=1 Tax=uncultured Bifidobacterium sp. TaxID=165187 RepID=UPI002613431E|nr:histidine phosphatase family protein [uncultured Bifidobacterium sp.]